MNYWMIYAVVVTELTEPPPPPPTTSTTPTTFYSFITPPHHTVWAFVASTFKVFTHATCYFAFDDSILLLIFNSWFILYMCFYIPHYNTIIFTYLWFKFNSWLFTSQTDTVSLLISLQWYPLLQRNYVGA